MKVMVIMKGDPTPDQQPTKEIFEMMAQFNRKLAEAGVLIGVDGLHPSFDAKRVTLAADGAHVVDGPFAETKELLSGFWVLSVDSFEEAIEWMRGSPLDGFGLELELRHVGEVTDFDPTAFTPDLFEMGEETRRLVLRNLTKANADAFARYQAAQQTAHDAAATANR